MANMTTQNETTGQARTENQSGSRSEAQSGARGESSPQRADSTQTSGGAQTTVGRVSSGAASLATKGVEHTRERIDAQISEQREKVSRRVRALGRALRGAGDVLEDDGLASHSMLYASDKIENVADYLAEITPDRVATDLRRAASSKPLWFYGSAFALGLALGRFARSSGESVASHMSEGEEGQSSTRSAALPRSTAENAQTRTTPENTQTRTPSERRP